MKKLLVMATMAALLCAASAAIANNGAVDLSWNKCDTSPLSTDKAYLCDGGNGGPFQLTGSFVMPFGVADFAAASDVVDIAFAGPVPDYWKTLSGECNAGAIGLSNPTPSAPCGPQLFDATVSAGGFATTYPAANRIRVRIDWATGAAILPAVNPFVRYAAFTLNFDPDNGVANGCAGCETPACIVLNSIQVQGLNAAHDYLLDSPDQRNFVTWQGGTSGCPAATPSRNATWGSVKSLYR